MKTRVLYDKRKSVYLFILVFVTYALIYMTKNCFSAAMASIVEADVMSKSDTGLIASMFYVFYAPFQIVGGIYVDRYSPYKLIFIGMIGAGILNLLIYFIEGYVAMLIIWSLNGIVQFGVWPGIFKIVTTEIMPEHRSSGLTYIHMAYTAGLAVSYLSAAFISDWKNNFLFSAVILFILAVVFLSVYKLLSRYMTEEEAGTADVKKVEYESIPLRKKIAVIIKAGIPLVMIISTIHSLLNLGIKALFPVMLMESYEGINASLANILNILLIVAGPIGLLASHTSFFKRIAPTKSLSLLFALSLPLLAVVCFIGSVPAVFAIAATSIIMAFTGAMSLMFSNIARGFEKYNCVGTLVGTINCMSALGILISNYAFSMIAEAKGWQFTAICWLAVASFAFILTLITIPLWSRFRKKNCN